MCKMPPPADARIFPLRTVTAALLSLDAKDRHMDVAGWLQGLGLERYEAVFRDNEIDWQVLSSLTADDLKTPPSPRPSPGSTALSPSTWAMRSWSISPTREPMRTMPSMRSGRRWSASTPSVASMLGPSSSKRACLLYRHRRMAGQQIDHHARMRRIEMLDQNKRHAGAGREAGEQPAGRIEAAGRGAEPDDREAVMPG
jgi:hypothetical protein